MIPFFDTPELREFLRDVAEDWAGTPFHKGSRAKGRDGGVDCVMLAQEIYYECGVISNRHPMPQYNIDFSQHQDESILERIFVDLYSREFRESDPAEPWVGDILLFKVGRCVHHCGVVHRPGNFIHSMKRYGTHETVIGGTDYGLELVRAFRPVK